MNVGSFTACSYKLLHFRQCCCDIVSPEGDKNTFLACSLSILCRDCQGKHVTTKHSKLLTVTTKHSKLLTVTTKHSKLLAVTTKHSTLFRHNKALKTFDCQGKHVTTKHSKLSQRMLAARPVPAQNVCNHSRTHVHCQPQRCLARCLSRMSMHTTDARHAHCTCADANTAARDANVEMVNLMLEALEKEHEVLYSTLVTPIANYIMDILPDDQRETSKVG